MIKIRLNVILSIIFGIPIGFMMISCAHEDPAEPSLTDNIETSNIELNINNNSLYFINNQTDEGLRLGGADSLVIYADGMQLSLNEVRDTVCRGVTCQYYYQYRFSLPVNPFSAYDQIVIAFERSNGISALNTTIDIVSSPTFSSPSADDTYSISNDNLPVSVLYNSQQSTFELFARGVCIDGGSYTLTSGQNDLIIPAGTLNYYDYSDSQFACADQSVFELNIRVVMSGIITVDSALNQNGFKQFVYEHGPDIQVTL